MALRRARRIAALPFLLFLALAIASAYASPADTSFNQTLNLTVSQLNALNNSAYLIFYPSTSNITSEIAHAKKIYLENPNEADSLLISAQRQIAAQRAKLYSYSEASLVVMIVMSAIIGYILYAIMKPVRSKKSSVSRRKKQK